jgi:general secretion pathway protein D
MDALADRAQFSLDSTGSNRGGGGGYGSSGYGSSRYGRSGSYRGSSRHGSSRYGSSRYSQTPFSSSAQTQQNTVVEDIQRDIPAESLLDELSRAPDEPLSARRIDQPGIVYVSVFRGSNDLLLRSSDPESLAEILEVIKQLDKPKPQVLLEVKVLDIALGDEDVRGIDWLFQSGDVSGGRSTGINSTTLGSSYGEISRPSASLVPRGTGLDSRAFVLQVVTDNVLGRIQLLEEQDRVVSLATPTLCVADNEASRVFVGTETTILKSVEIEQNTTTGDNPVTTTTVDPETDRQNVGTTLLITPRIHADRTATIRIVQEESRLGNVQTINFGDSESFQSQDVETRSVVTTVVAADGQICAVGGLIREEVANRNVGVPGLMDVPGVGSLFKTQSKSRERHELLVLIRPFILLAPGEAEPISKTMLTLLSELPAARNDIPALHNTEGGFKPLGQDLSVIPSQAIDSLSEKATIWTTE